MTRSLRKMPCLLSFVLLALLGSQSLAQSGRVTPTPTPEEPIKVETEEIKLNVLAFDSQGRFFKDVSANDLVITENDILHQPASVRRIPANVLIVLDTGGEMRYLKSLDKTRQVARALIGALGAEDNVAIMQYADTAELIDEFTNDRRRTLDAIMKRTKFGRGSALIEAVTMATDMLRNLPVDNRHLVFITDGTDGRNRSSARFDAFQKLMATDISVHVFSYTSMESTDIEPRTKGISKSPPPKAMPDEVAKQLPNGARDVATAPKMVTINTDRTFIRSMKARKASLDVAEAELRKLADSTNGEFILPTSVDEMIEKAPLVARMIDSAYVVTYVPKVPIVATRGLAERKIEVTSKRPGLEVQARRRLLVQETK
ncbi:MAG: VWA domain-containing protein [Blastocatellia bacterium]|nr:VWA domain-containing protein [Blastocatellia bacterium]